MYTSNTVADCSILRPQMALCTEDCVMADVEQQHDFPKGRKDL